MTLSAAATRHDFLREHHQPHQLVGCRIQQHKIPLNRDGCLNHLPQELQVVRTGGEVIGTLNECACNPFATGCCENHNAA